MKLAFSRAYPVIVMCLLAWSAKGASSAVGAEPDEGKSLFDGQTLDGWKITEFGGEGDVLVEDGRIVLEFGSSLTGIHYGGQFPKTNYEVTVEAMRIEGSDFFCGMTFPVADSHASFIVGGWGGAVVGISSIDGQDASENDTTRIMSFDKGRWYKIKLRVTPKRIQTWIDDSSIVDQDIEGRRISTRSEVNLSKPFGFCAWETKAALRNIRLREIEP